MTSHRVINVGEFPRANPGTNQVVTNKGNPSHRGLTRMTSHGYLEGVKVALPRAEGSTVLINSCVVLSSQGMGSGDSSSFFYIVRVARHGGCFGGFRFPVAGSAG